MIGRESGRTLDESTDRESSTMLGIYFFLKLMLFFAIVKALVKFETLQDHFLFLGILYTRLVALISYVFVVSTRQVDFQALHYFLNLRYIPGERTLFEGVRRLPPAHCLVLERGTKGERVCRKRARQNCEIHRAQRMRRAFRDRAGHRGSAAAV